MTWFLPIARSSCIACPSSLVCYVVRVIIPSKKRTSHLNFIETLGMMLKFALLFSSQCRLLCCTNAFWLYQKKSSYTMMAYSRRALLWPISYSLLKCLEVSSIYKPKYRRNFELAITRCTTRRSLFHIICELPPFTQGLFIFKYDSWGSH